MMFPRLGSEKLTSIKYTRSESIASKCLVLMNAGFRASFLNTVVYAFAARPKLTVLILTIQVVKLPSQN